MLARSDQIKQEDDCLPSSHLIVKRLVAQGTGTCTPRRRVARLVDFKVIVIVASRDRNESRFVDCHDCRQFWISPRRTKSKFAFAVCQVLVNGNRFKTDSLTRDCDREVSLNAWSVDHTMTRNKTGAPSPTSHSNNDCILLLKVRSQLENGGGWQSLSPVSNCIELSLSS